MGGDSTDISTAQDPAIRKRLEEAAVAAADAGARKAAAEAEKAEGDVAKAKTDALAAKATSLVPEVPEAPFQGTVDVKEKAGQAEINCLVYRAVSRGAELVKASLAYDEDATLFLFPMDHLPKFEELEAFESQNTALQTALGGTLDGSKRLNEHDAEAEEQWLVRHPEPPARTKAILPALAAPVAAQAFTAAVNLLGYLRTDYSLGGEEVNTEDLPLILEVAGAIKRTKPAPAVEIPSLYVSDAPLQAARTAFDTYLTKLTGLATQAALRHDEHVASAAKWAERAKSEKDAGLKAEYQDLAERHKQMAVDLEAALKMYRELLFSQSGDQVAAARIAGFIRNSAILKEMTAAESAGHKCYVLGLKIAAAAGSHYSKQSIWNVFRLRIPFWACGAVTCEFAQFRHDGALVGSGAIPVHTPHRSLSKLDQTARTEEAWYDEVETGA
jgi:hypothetical protein